jgi:excisionase family DNA binding protein
VDELVAYLTPKDAADLLRVSVKSVLRWAAADRSMPVLRIGQTVRFPRERLLRWLREREQGRPAARHLTDSPVPSAARSGS